jgi:hypothetical protein
MKNLEKLKDEMETQKKIEKKEKKKGTQQIGIQG